MNVKLKYELLEGAFASIKELDERLISFYKTLRPNVKIGENPVGGFYFFQSEDILFVWFK